MNALTSNKTIETQKVPVIFQGLRLIPYWCALFVFLIGILVFTGWVFEIDFLKRIVPGYVLMNPATAVTFLISGATLWLLQSADSRHLRITRIGGAVVAAIGVIKLCAIAGFFDIGIDRILFADRLLDNVSGNMSEMAPTSALNFLLLGTAFLWFGAKTKPRDFFPAQYLAVLVLLISFLTIISYLYGAKAFYSVTSLNPMGIHTAFSFLLLAVGLLLSRSQRGIIKELFSVEAGGDMARRLFPMIIFIPVFLGWLELQGENHHLYKIEIGNALLIIAIIVIFSAVILNNARTMNIVSRKRKQAFQESAASKLLLTKFVAHAPAAVAMLDTELRYLQVSERWLQDNKLIGQDIIGKSHYEVFPNIPDKWKESLRRSLAGAVEKCDEDPMLRADGATEWLQWETRPWHKADGEIGGLVIFTQLITERKRTEELVRLSEEKYRNILGSIEEGYFETDLKGNFTFFNEALCTILGYHKDEVQGMNYREYVDRENGKKLFAKLLEIFKTGQFVNQLDWEIIRRDNSRRSVESSMSLMRDADQKPIGFRGLVRDVTGRKQSEEFIRQSEKKYRDILQTIQEGYYELDLSGNLVFFNEKLCELSGFSREEFHGLNYKAYIDEKDADNVVACFKEVYATGIPINALQWQQVRKDGTRGCRESSISLMRNESNQPIGFRGMVRDITDRVRAENESRVISEMIQGVSSTSNLDELLELIHQSLKKVFYAENCFVALYDKNTELLNMQFFVDKYDPPPPPFKLGRRQTAYVFRHGRPMLLNRKIIDQLVAEGEIEIAGTPPAAWLGVPLRIPSGVIGVLVVQNYEDENAYNSRDLELLTAVGDQIALAIERKRAEDNLRQSQEWLAAMFEASQDGIVVEESDHIVFVNKRYCQMYGCEDAQEIIGSPTSRFLTPEDSERMVEYGRKRRNGEQVPTVYEFKSINKNGEVNNFEASISTFTSNGKFYIVTAQKDITERKRIEESIKQNEERLKKQNKVLLELARRSAESDDLNFAIKEITEITARTLDADRASVWLYNEENSKIRAVDLYEQNANIHTEGIELSNTDFPTYFKALETESSIVAHDAQTDYRTKEFKNSYLVPLGITSMLDIPIRFGGQTMGVVCVEHVGAKREWRLDEQNFLGSITDAVSLMMEKHERHLAEQALHKETALVELLKTIAIAANESESVEDALQICIDKVCQLMNWQYGHVALPVKDSPEELIIMPIWYVDDQVRFEKVIREMKDVRFGKGVGLIGRVLESRKAIWIKDVTQESSFTRKELAQEVGLKGSFAFPILWQSEVLGVLTFFSEKEEEPNEKLLQVMTSIGNQLGQAIMRKQAEEALQISEERHRLLFESNPQPAFVYDLKTFAFIAVNEATVRHYGYTREELLSSVTVKDIRPPEDVPKFIERVYKVKPGRDTMQAPSRHQKKDGTIIDVEITSHVLNFTGRQAEIVLVNDVTERKRAEKELLESQQLLKTVMDTLPQAIWWKDRNSVFLGANQFLAKAAGFDSPEQMVGLTDYDMPWTKEEAELSRECDRRVMESGIPELNMIESFEQSDATPLWININKAPLRNADGEIVGVIGGFMDITEQRLAEEALQNSHDYLSSIINAVADPIFVNDRQHRMVLVNDAFCKLEGRSREEIIGKGTDDFCQPEEASIYIEMDNLVFESGKEMSNEEQFTDSHGNQHILMTKKSLYKDQHGERFIVGVIRDITESKKTEEALREKEAKFRDLFDNAPIAYHELDTNGCFTRINHTEELLLGYSEEELIGRHPSEIIVEQESREATAAKLIGKAPLHAVERTFIRKDGTLISVLNEDRLIYDKQGNVTGIRSTLQDITERKREEMERQAITEIVQGAITTSSLEELFEIAYRAINRVIFAENCYLAFHDPATGLLRYEFWKDKVRPIPAPQPIAKNFGSHVLKTKQPLLLTEEIKQQLYRDGEVANSKYSPSWMGVPLRLATTAIGILVVQDYERHNVYSARDLEMLGAIGDQLALAIERKRAEEAIRLSEEKYRNILETIQEGYYETDLNGKFIFFNDALCESLGYPREELMGLTNRELMDEENAKSLYNFFKEVYTSNQSKLLKSWEIKRKNGERRTHESSLSVIRNHKNEPIGFRGLARDVTERYQMEQELERARDAALESARLKSEFLANMSHEIRTPMNGVIGMTGLLLDTALSEEQHDYAKTVQSSAEALLRIIDDILDFSKIEAGKLHFERIDFDLRDCVESSVESLAERAQSKGVEIASLVYRDVPTPLSGDPGRLRQILTNLIGNAVKFTEKGEVTVKVRKESDRGKYVQLRFEVTDTGIGISEPAQRQLFQAFVQADGSTTRKYGGTGLGLAISKQLVDIMGGKIGVESTPGKGSTFWFTARFEKQAQPLPNNHPIADVSLENVRVLIVDDNATNRRIFLHQTTSWAMLAAEADSGARALEMLRAAAENNEPFDIAILDLMMPEMDGFELARAIKADPSLSKTHLLLMPSYGKRGDGQTAREFGIAAYIQKPVRQSQLYDCLLTVIAESILENGENQLPRLITRHSLRSLTKSNSEAATAISKARILVAEDNAVNQKVAMSQLKSLGYAAEIVENGRQALEAVKKYEYDLVLMDCQMPEMDGFEATAEIRRFEADSRRTNIIAMTAHALEGERERCLAAGMDDYISKPVKLEKLKEMLQKWAAPRESGQSGDQPVRAHDASENKKHYSVDLSVINGFKDLQLPNEPDIITDLIDLFLSDAERRIAKLKNAIANQETAAIRAQAHGLQGSSGNIGARHLTFLSENLTQKTLDLKEAEGLISEIEVEYHEVRRILTALRLNGAGTE